MSEGPEGRYGSAKLAGTTCHSIDRDANHAAVDGDQEAWEAMVERFAPVVWSAARGRQLSRSGAAEVFRVTWMRLSDHLPFVPPEAIGGWLQETADREAVRLLHLHPGEMQDPLCRT